MIEILKKQIENNALPHAYLFSGADEVEKEKTIEYLLKNILGDNYLKNPDLHQIKGSPDEHIGVEDSRVLKLQALSTPLFGEKNVFLIYNIEYISREAANSLLKVLEEPPKHVIIIATTMHLESVLPTLRSRFSKLSFSGQEEKEEGELKKIKTMSYPKRFAKAAEISKQNNFEELIESAILEASYDLRTKVTKEAVLKIDGLININLAIKDQTINKRLLAEYFMMII
jgi:DNA polymerase III delta prime subunit